MLAFGENKEHRHSRRRFWHANRLHRLHQCCEIKSCEQRVDIKHLINTTQACSGQDIQTMDGTTQNVEKGVYEIYCVH